MITYLKSLPKALGFGLQTDMILIFQILVKGLQKYERSKLEVEKNICQLGRPRAHGFGRYFFPPPTLTCDIFAAPIPKLMFSTSFKRSISYLLGDKSPRLLNDF